MPTSYRGRFAPSPTGPLHFGSLLAALASYLDAKAHQGHWLVRIEDLDPPREIAGASDAILRTLEAFGLHWDERPLYQSQRLARYQQVLEQLQQQGLVYPCQCSRSQLQHRQAHPCYDGFCRRHPPSTTSQPWAYRLWVSDAYYSIEDRIQGHYGQSLHQEVGDFVIKRKEGFFAYQLAVVVDDFDQGISHIVRGSDLLDSTPRQCYLQQLLMAPQPSYAHIPVITNAQGQKLSKQTFAPALNPQQVSTLTAQALAMLSHPLPPALESAPVAEQLAYAQTHWRTERLPARLSFATPYGV